jgi:hypothetical protein
VIRDTRRRPWLAAPAGIGYDARPMSKRSRPPGAGPAGPARRPSAKEKQHARQKARRMRQVQALGTGFKERFMSGCIAFGIIGFLMLCVFLTWTCVVKPD